MVGKRKATAEKSTNEFTKRVEKRRNEMTEHEPKKDEVRLKRIYYEKMPPHMYFTKTQLAVWRNFASWSFDGDQVYLPSPAKWYPEGYDTTRAWEMLREEVEPAEYKWILPLEDQLLLLALTKESKEFLS
ncbi:hypothetical protein V501_01065 [Pseudogymnoascus sp. VKM F-4519 (FW-2642)]|nr:hypothetical protein V501_01065 [Pseudogymnoascus sp. VKM F-4519 (FW-2642)]